VSSRTSRRGRTDQGKAGESTKDLPVSERREAILAIAAEIFARKGFTNTTVREIADEAGILSGSLYHHFDSKETMVDEVLSGFLDDMVKRYQAVVDSVDDPLEALKSLIRLAFDALLPHRAALMVAQNESHYLQQFERFAYLQHGYTQVEEQWTSVLEAGIEAGMFRGDLDVKLVYLFMRDTIWRTVRWYQPGGRHTLDDLADTYVALVLDGIRVDEAPKRRGRRSSAASA
jgi:TetR/AcrR family transcriptional regulator, cholesterol catabolism regulator